ncbi:O-antigen ligase family protein [Paenibacillus lycopersici]|uniref:O-antigen ligase family protein n=1 Tax=Paenibacillus lycopersici TaxID=2704462 RepID=A0A6C0FQ45_9BACL|nr:O-antigen ligase family protein [Paenibacillus lycopersici]QHT59256.1 O-antigen ligase family protein [Paenibacillus lycopersici]
MNTSHASKFSKSEKDLSLIKWSGLAVITLLLFIAPYNSSKLFVGYLFTYEPSLVGAEVAFFILLLAGTIYMYKTARLDSWKAILSASAWLMPLSYLISNIGAASVHQSHIMIFVVSFLSAIFMLGLYYGDSNKARQLLLYGIQFAGYGVVFYGLANMMGQIYFPDALWYQQEVYRVTSVFQYPNAYAAYLSALFLAGLFLVVQVRSAYWRLLHAFMLVPIWVSFMLTLSRGALVIVPVLILLTLPFLRFKQQLLFMLYACISIVVSFGILGKMTSTMNAIAKLVLPEAKGGQADLMSIWSKLPLTGWSVIIAAGLLAGVVVTLLHLLLNDRLESRFAAFAEKKRSYVIVPAVLIIVTVLAAAVVLLSSSVRQLLPGEIADRLENINFNQHSVLERGTFYKDAMKISADYPIFGAGGGAWNALYEKYQHNPYSSKQVHSYFLQTLVETGWVGLLLLIGFLACIFFIYLRCYIKDKSAGKTHFVFYIFAVSILIHSAIDFDMSYIYLSAIVFLSLGLMGAVYSSQLVLPAKIREDESAGKIWRFGFPTGVALLAVVMLVGAGRAYMANGYYSNAIALVKDNKHELKDLLTPLDSALAYSPSNPEFILRKIDWLNQAYNQTKNKQYEETINALIGQLRQSDPYNRSLTLVEYTFAKNEGDTNKALTVLEEGIQNRPWNIEFYERAIYEYSQAGKLDQQSNNAAEGTKWTRARELYAEVLHRIDLLKDLPKEQLQGRDFSVTPLMRLAIGQIDVEQKQYSDAVSVLKPLTKSKLEEQYVPNALRIYLNALEAQGKDDKKTREKLSAYEAASRKQS